MGVNSILDNVTEFPVFFLLKASLRSFEGFLILVWFGVGQVQKTELSSHFKTLRLPVGVGGMFNDSWHH